uniref:F-box domain-containing protein n=1 Tax=Oryza glumipatula TaxID=40148 RepID=A0A0D9ZB64_9ORYZ
MEIMEEPLAARGVEVVLPEDVLAEILRRLPPRSLAALRCVCTDWRSTIDSHRLLRADLLPLSLAGIFIDFWGLRFPDFFSRPPPTPISGVFDFFPLEEGPDIMDHCNGLFLLFSLLVVNPATQRWACLPPLPSHSTELEFRFLYDQGLIVFDPIVSPQYEVFMIPFVNPGQYCIERTDLVLKESEWPPSPLILHVFSSVAERWEERSFVREGDSAGTVAYAQRQCHLDKRGNFYWRGALYVNSYFLMRISISDGSYQVIHHPIEVYKSRPHVYFGKSEKGVYLASLTIDGRLSIWVLDESCGQFKWVLEHQNNLKPLLLRLNRSKQVYGPWILRDINYHLYSQKFPGEWNLYNQNYDPSHFHSPNDEAPTENNFEWHSDDDDIVDNQCNSEERNSGDYLTFLGFHPYKEVVFMSSGSMKGFAYHLKSSKLQCLGNLYPKHYEHFAEHEHICQSFPYTPCWVDELPETSISVDNLCQD